MAYSAYKSPSTRQGRARGSAVQKDRKVLFQDANNGGRGGGNRNNNRKKKASSSSSSSSTASEAQSIAQSLQRTQNLLKNELDRVSQVASAIDEDGRMLNDAKDDLKGLDVSNAAKALTSLQRAQQQEQRVLTASILFFFVVVAFIMWERILIKLPFVERILDSFWGTTKIVGRRGIQITIQLLHQMMEQIQDMIDNYSQ